MRRLLPILASAALLLAGCSRRERANPFDPLNPSTNGRPAGFAALAGDREVRLRWQAAQGNSLIGYQIFRRAPNETGYRALTDVLATGVTSFRDFPLTNGQDHAYRLYFVFLSGIGTRPAEDAATPGPAVPWLIEGGGTDLVKITPDDRRVADRIGGYGATTDLAANPADGRVWVTDEGFGRVVVYQPLSRITVSIPGLDRPRAVAVDPIDGTGWVCDVGNNLVYHFTPRGDLVPSQIAPLSQPVDVAVDPSDGSVWVCELGSDLVGRFNTTVPPPWTHPVVDPSRVALDSTTREGWITSYLNGTVTHLSPLGQPLASPTGFTSPLGVAVDARRGRIWIADPGAASVVALHRDGSEEFRVTGLADAGELAVDLGSGEAWVVLGRPGELARISPAGVVLRRMGGFRSPIAVSVDPGGR
jgi:DNA-binding beta-propeller fold protein YncE